MSPDFQAKHLQHLQSPGLQAGIAFICLTSAVIKCTRDGIRSAGFLDTFERFREKENRIEEREWQIKHAWVEMLSKGSLGGEPDNFGGLIMADSTMERFMIINYYDMDDFPKYHALNERRAKELMSLLRYLGVPQPKWVRSTYMVFFIAHDPFPAVLLPLATLDAKPTTIPDLAPSPEDPEDIRPPIVHLNGADEELAGGISFPSFQRIEWLLQESFDGAQELGGGKKGRRERRPRVTDSETVICEECGVPAEKKVQRCE
ncbi:hypothetical protein RQP46_006358 [Phenoliferia psychrophenolica]